MPTVTLYPSSYDTENYSWRTSSNISRGYTSSSSTTYARFGIPTYGGEAYIYYKFDTSSIPDGATIVSVSCTAKAAANGNSTTTPVKQIQMATGTTLKGTATSISSTATERTLDVGSWTLAELRDIRIRPYAKTGSSTASNYNLDFYGATLTIEYTLPGPSYTVKVKDNGSWVDATKVLVKSSGSWTEATNVLAKDNGTWK